MTPNTILDFWYSEPMNQHWFNSTPAIDHQLRQQFESLWEHAHHHALDDWQVTPEGCLALCIILDQFPLNMFRGNKKAYSTEQQAVQVTKQAVERGFDKQLAAERVAFLYLPLMHSENLTDQALSVQLFEAAGLANNAKFARHHQEIIQRFGRFPHRNEALGRISTPEELEYLNSKEAFKG
ncbi:DUF924 family protein [Thiolinea disciformis]|uniref:DUF924 family protein n=1 Tax=Thiolinea disciformis TaxID=125614 RepID=UPI000377DA20|nr:DUF924 family protein [Thiolinea disciformis]